MQESTNHRGIMKLQLDIYQNFPKGKPNPYMPPLKETCVNLYDVKRVLIRRQPNTNFSFMICYFCFDFYF